MKEKYITYEKMAIALVHLVYRNTKVEDFHSKNRKMNGDMYDDVHQIVDFNLKTVLQNGKIIYALLGVFDEESYRIIKTKTYDEDFLKNLEFNLMMGATWNQPKLLNEKPKDKDFAKYLLEGEFLKNCDGENSLDDDMMKKINIDISNRMFTLLKEKYLF